MYSVWFRSTFRRDVKFVQIKEGGDNFWGEPILQIVWIIWSPLLYLNFKSFPDPIPLSFIVFHYVLHDSGVLFEESWNLYKLKMGDVISGEEPILQNVWIIWSPLLFSNFKSFLDQNSSSLIRFQSILHESGRLSSESWNFLKLKRGELICWGNQFRRMSELFGPPFCFSI